MRVESLPKERIFDVLVSTFLLVALGPLFACTALAVVLSMGRPILFRQRRTGLRDGTFELLKFRTMTDARDGGGTVLPDEERLTRTGEILRATSLDEIPQLWNVLRGEMSLVGPRPLLPEYLPRYNPRQRLRQSVKPGITGWAQVNGRNALSWEEKLELDAWYVDHRTFWLDLKILWLTLIQVARRHGIRQNGHATMPTFIGSSTQDD